MPAPPVVVITGASAGIGRATAIRFAREGATIVLAARSRDRLQRLAQRLEERFGVETLAIACDVRDREQVAALVEAALAGFGRIDVLVNNAGYGLYGRIEDTPDEAFRDLLETNVLGVHHAVRAVLPHMRRRASGHIVNVGSVVGKRSWPYHGAYAASKFALTGLTQALRGELAGSGRERDARAPRQHRHRVLRERPHLLLRVRPRPPRPGPDPGPGRPRHRALRAAPLPRGAHAAPHAHRPRPRRGLPGASRPGRASSTTAGSSAD